MAPLPISYVLPIKVPTGAAPDEDLARYLHELVGQVAEVVVVDGSAPRIYEEHEGRWPGAVIHVPPSGETPNGKVAGVITGVRAATQPTVVLADDDVRWSAPLLEAAVALLDRAEVVRPQNAFEPRPWHARWDTGRTLIHRALGGDWPGTLAFRRAAFPPGGYAGDVLFENLELVRTMQAAGCRELVALDLVVPRRPPSARQFLDQRVRQAYDELARPRYLLAELALLPTVLVGGRRAAGALALGAVGVAEVGRRRSGGSRVWGASDSALAPLWLAERSITVWLAVAARVRGGVRYRGGRLLRAASRAPRPTAGRPPLASG